MSEQNTPHSSSSSEKAFSEENRNDFIRRVQVEILDAFEDNKSRAEEIRKDADECRARIRSAVRAKAVFRL